MKNPERVPLKPCPFDGGGAYLAEVMQSKFPFAIRCKSCGASTAWLKSKGLAVSRWNWRIK